MRWDGRVRTITDDERRARLGRRHALASPVARPLEAARAVVCLHATEPASVHLAAWARSGASRSVVDAALFEDRSLVRQLGMRRTVFTVPRDLLPAVWGSAAARVAGQQWRRLVGDVEKVGVRDGAAWAEEHLEAALALIGRHGGLATAELRELLPALDLRLTRGAGSAWEAQVAVARQVVTVLGAQGRLLRGPNDGTWKTSRHRWVRTEDWLGAPPQPLSERDGYAALVRRWLAAFGPGTEADVVWWLGATKAAVRRALVDVGAVQVMTSAGPAYVLPDDVEPVAPPEPWVALLPALDPTTMGWKQRAFYLGPHGAALFDRNGNGGPTAWWNGRIVGGWTQAPDGTVLVVPAEPLPAEADRGLRAAADRLTTWLAGDVVRSIYQSPLVRALG